MSAVVLRVAVRDLERKPPTEVALEKSRRGGTHETPDDSIEISKLYFCEGQKNRVRELRVAERLTRTRRTHLLKVLDELLERDVALDLEAVL